MPEAFSQVMTRHFEADRVLKALKLHSNASAVCQTSLEFFSVSFLHTVHHFLQNDLTDFSMTVPAHFFQNAATITECQIVCWCMT